MNLQLIEKVLNWSTKVNIISAGYVDGQCIKLGEEAGELCSWIARNNLERIKDTIGDIQFMLINISEMSGVSRVRVERAFSSYEEESNKSVAYHALEILYQAGSLNPIFDEEGKSDGASEEYILDAINEISGSLHVIANHYNLDVTECLEAAYEEVKDREGIFYNKVFIKSDDFTVDLLNEIKATTMATVETLALIDRHLKRLQA